MMKHKVIEYQRLNTVDGAGMVSASLQRVAEHYGLIASVKEKYVQKFHGEDKEVTHILYLRFAEVGLGNILEIDGEKYQVVGIRRTPNRTMLEEELSWQG
jgi:hypothetical protein